MERKAVMVLVLVKVVSNLVSILTYEYMIFSSKEDFFSYCKRHGPLIILITLLIAWNAVFIYLRLARYLTFHYPGWDLGFFDQVIWLMSHGEVVATVLQRNLFVDHFSPILYLFVPFYWVGIGMYTLLIVYPLIISLGTIPLYHFTKRISSDRWLPLLNTAWIIYAVLY